MASTTRIFFVAPLAALVLLAGCKDAPSSKPAAPAASPSAAPQAAAVPAKAAAPQVNTAMLAMFRVGAVDAASPKDPEPLVRLGRMLYFEKRLSKNHDVSCNTCHDLATYGVDNLPVSAGHKGLKGDRNSPTVYDAANHFVQFWDGRAKDLAEQAKGPVLNPVEMAMPDEARVVETLRSIPEYVQLFEAAFPGAKDAVSFDNMAEAIAAFERGLVTRSRFDRYLDGDASALDEQEQRGLALFTTGGCTACHMGPNLGATMFQKTGLVKPWPDQKDEGRAAVTKNDADKFMFKVSALRNVEKTAPYFHDGSVADLKQAVAMMGEYQLGRTFSDAELDDLVAFLKSLTGDLPTDYIVEPKLPASTAKTPKPDPS